MTRIFDALKKAEANRGPAAFPAAQVTPLSSPPVGSPAGSRALNAASLAGADAWRVPMPLHGEVELGESEIREMTTLRVAIEASIPDRSPRTVLFVAPQGGEGSSTLALQFAQTLARDPSLRPLFVEGHARRPTLLADPSQRRAVLDPQLARRGGESVVATHLLALPLPDDVRRTALLQPQTLRVALDAVGPGFDWIVMDGPPVLDAPETSSLAAIADGVVLVLQAGRTRQPVVQRSVELLRKAGARVLGSVLNRRVHEIPEFLYRRL